MNKWPEKSFAESDFCVTFNSECSESRIIRGWESVLNYLDQEMFPGGEYSHHSPCCDLHDEDCWRLLDNASDGDRRHTFEQVEFGYCVGIHIARITDKEIVERVERVTACEDAG